MYYKPQPSDNYKPTFEEAHGKYRTKGNRVVYIETCPDGSIVTKAWNRRFFKSFDEFHKWLERN